MLLNIITVLQLFEYRALSFSSLSFLSLSLYLAMSLRASYHWMLAPLFPCSTYMSPSHLLYSSKRSAVKPAESPSWICRLKRQDWNV